MEQIFAEPVRAAIEETLSSGITERAFRERVAAILQEHPSALHSDAPLHAATLTIGAFQAAGGESCLGVLAGAAVELMTTAAHLLDRLADQDHYSTSADLQVATALLFLAGNILEQTRASAEQQIDWRPVYIRMTMVCGGQQADIDLQSDNYVTLRTAKLMTEAKTGAFGEALMLAGAIAAGASPEFRAELGQLGNLLGTCSQLLDDASDASTRAPTTSDIALRKKTVPIAYFLDCRGDRLEWDRLRDSYLVRGLSDEEEYRMRSAIEESGALALTLTLGNWYRLKAQAVLDSLDVRGCETSLLQQIANDLRSPESLRSELATAYASDLTG